MHFTATVSFKYRGYIFETGRRWSETTKTSCKSLNYKKKNVLHYFSSFVHLYKNIVQIGDHIKKHITHVFRKLQEKETTFSEI